MKDPLKNFNVEKTLKQLSDKTIDQLLTTKAGVEEAKIQTFRQAASKKSFQIYQADVAQESMECYRILRTAFFFHQHPDKVPALRKYLTSKNASLEKFEVAAAKSEADHVTQLYLVHPTHVPDYFTICFHTCQSRRYVQRRTDYVESGTPPTAISAKVKELDVKLMAGLKNERGTGKSKLHQFEHGNKLFVIMEFNDLPTYVREFENEQPEDHFRRFALDLTYVFDLITGAVDVIADSAELRQQMHEVSAAVIYGKEAIAARPPKNEVFDLQKLMDMLITGTPLSNPNTHTGISKVIANEVTLKRQKPPFWQSTLRAGFTVKNAALQRDAITEMQRLIGSAINTKDEPGGWWHKSYVELTRAELLAIYFDRVEGKEIAKIFTVKNSGDTNLGHDENDEAIKKFLRGIGLLKEKSAEELALTTKENKREEPEFSPATVAPALV